MSDALTAFRASLADLAPSASLPLALRALWFDAKGDWDEAHRLAQADESGDGSWVHAYLHRREGDTGNAGYWYARAGKPAASGSLEDEWARIAEALLSQASKSGQNP